MLQLRREIDQIKQNNATIVHHNSSLQAELDGINHHIRVVSNQNDQLTREIDQFVQVNEKIKSKLGGG